MPINVKMPTIVGILTFMSRINFVLSCVEHEKSFITSGPENSTVQSLYNTPHYNTDLDITHCHVFGPKLFTKE